MLQLGTFPQLGTFQIKKLEEIVKQFLLII
jgi:hypothetical protein